MGPRNSSRAVSALIASGQLAQLTNHLNRAMDNELTRAESTPYRAMLGPTGAAKC